jgi:hypothetical protein
VPNVPEFPTVALPAVLIIGILGAVLFIQRAKETYLISFFTENLSGVFYYSPGEFPHMIHAFESHPSHYFLINEDLAHLIHELISGK